MTTKNGLLAELERDPWLMEERAMHAFMARVAEAAGRIPTDKPVEVAPAGYRIEQDGTAVIQIHGTLMKSVPWYYERFGIAATAYQQIEAQVTAAAADPKVAAIRLDVDSHGGSSAGVKRAGDAIFAARSSGKPVLARVEDVACSAAYWLAAQAQEISAGPMAMIGSIGTYMTFMDLERMAKNEGIEVQVISSGPLKGAGIPGTRLTPAQKADIQKWVEDLTEIFVGDVARGRAMAAADVEAWATGGTWLGDEAKRMGLVDRVESHQQLSARAAAVAAGRRSSNIDEVTKTDEPAAGEGARPASDTNDRVPSSEGDIPMTDAERKALEEKAAADARAAERTRVSQITALYGSKDPELAQKAIGEGWSVEQTKAAYADLVDAKLEKERAARAESDKKLEAAQKAAATGAAPVPTGGNPADVPAAVEKDFMALSREYAEKNKCSMRVAMKAVNDANPGLHEKAARQWAARAEEVHQRKLSLGMKV